MTGDDDDAGFIDAEKLSSLWWGLGDKKVRGAARLSNAERLSRAVLLFFDPGDFNDEKRAAWKALTGNDECSSKRLGDLAREVRAEEERHSAVVLVLAAMLDEINEQAGNKWVWKNHASESAWIRARLLPWIRAAAHILTEKVGP